MRKLLALVTPFVVAAVMAAAAYGFMAANTVEPHSAGFGAGKVTGYHISNSYYYWAASPDSYCAGCTPHVWGVQYDITPVPNNWLETWFRLDDGSTTPHQIWVPGYTAQCTLSDHGDGNATVFCGHISPTVPLEKLVGLEVAAENFP